MSKPKSIIMSATIMPLAILSSASESIHTSCLPSLLGSTLQQRHNLSLY